jgi:hypothetical protein
MNRDHEPITLSNFKGLWQRGNVDEVPPDHFTDCNNIKFIANGNVATRPGVDLHQDVMGPLGNVLRIYNYITSDGNTLLVLVKDTVMGLPGASLYHVVDSTTVFGPILSLQVMNDFGFVAYGGRAYISPSGTFVDGNIRYQTGLPTEFLYVYDGSNNPGSLARAAGGAKPTGAIVPANGVAGNTDAGFHLFGVVFETDTGYLTAPGAFAGFTTSSTSSVSFSSVPVSGDSFVVKRHIVATKVIPTYNGDTTGYTYYFIPHAEIPDNVTTTLNNISFFDADLLEDASRLLDNFTNPPAGVNLTLYHNRLVLCTTNLNISTVYVSELGEPEAFNQVDGVKDVPPEGNPITQIQELRDVLYVFKRSKTLSYVDKEDLPATWPLSSVDQALGCPIHGIASVIDVGASNIDYLIIATFRGLAIFNGRYNLPELSWKISNFWQNLNKSNFNNIQIINDSINQIFYIVLTDGRILIGDYQNGLDPQQIRWAPWEFSFHVTTVALTNINDLIIGADRGM